MAQLALTGLLDRFPSGTTVGAYPQSNWATYQIPPSGAPVGSATTTGNVSAAGAVTLTGLADDTDYFITDSSGTKYVRSSTRVSHAFIKGGDTAGGDLSGTLPSPSVKSIDAQLAPAPTGTDRAALQSLIDNSPYAVGVVDIALRPGTYVLDATGPLSLPKSAVGLRIRGAGVGSTTIQLSTAAKRAFDLVRTADYDVFQNIEISDLTVDANNVASAQNQHVLLGNLRDGNWDPRLNFDNIAIRRCKTINVPAADTDGVSTGARQSVSLVSRHSTTAAATGDVTNTSASIANATGTWRIGTQISGTGIPAGAFVTNVVGTTLTISQAATATNVGVALTGAYGEATQTSVKNILIEDCNFGGAYGVVVMGSNSGTAGANVYCDNINVNRLRWDRGSVAAASSGSAGIQIGGTGYGGRCSIRDSVLLNSGDVGIEIDGMTYSLVDNTTCRDAYNYNFFARNFASPEYPQNQRAVFSNCKAEVIGLNPAIGAAASNGYALSHTSAPTPTFGTFVLDRCQFVSRAANAQVVGQAILANGTPVSKIVIRDFGVDHTTINYTPGSGQNPSLVYVAPNVNYSLDMRGLRFKVAGAANTNVTPFLTRIGGSSTTGRIYIDGYEVDYNVTGLTNGATQCIDLGAGTNVTLGGQIKGFKALQLAGDTLPKRIVVQGTATLTIDKAIHISDNDFGSGTGGFEVNYAGTSNAAKVFYGRGNIWGTNIGNPPADAAITAPASGVAYQNLDGYPETVWIQGGTGTLIEINRDGTNWRTVFSQAAAAFAGVSVDLENGDQLRVTYTVAPTFRKVPHK